MEFRVDCLENEVRHELVTGATLDMGRKVERCTGRRKLEFQVAA